MATKETGKVEDFLFDWQGKDRTGKPANGEMRAHGPQQVQVILRRRGIIASKITKRRMRSGRPIRARDIAIFTRQVSTMMRAGVPLLQAFDIVGHGHVNPRMARLVASIRSDVESGTSLSDAFARHPAQFSKLYCSLAAAGEAAGILDELMARLAMYMEKIEAIKSRIKSALMYPAAVLAVAFTVVAIIMVFVVPSFKEVFTSFGADLPAPTLAVIAASEFLVRWWWLVFGLIFGGSFAAFQVWRHSPKAQWLADRLLLRVPVLGPLMRKSIVARWTRTLATMFAAGVPMVEALESVGSASGSTVYEKATTRMRSEVATGISLTYAMNATRLFPQMAVQMAVIGEESGALDEMLSKAADFYEAEVDDMVAGLSSLIEPIIIVVLGTLIGGIVISMYLPVFKLGQVV